MQGLSLPFKGFLLIKGNTFYLQLRNRSQTISSGSSKYFTWTSQIMVLVSKQTRLTNKRSVVSFTDGQASSCINNLPFVLVCAQI